MHRTNAAAVDLWWIPLGAGDRVVRRCGRIYERVRAGIEGRSPCALYHTALTVLVPDATYVIESAPVHGSARPADRGVVVEGPVGTRWAGRSRYFRYEIRCWRGGSISDARWAVSSPVRLTDDQERARRVLDLVPTVPAYVWGRDVLGIGDMWTSNSLTSWLLVGAGLDGEGTIRPPATGRAPGWDTGRIVAARA